MSVLTSSLSSPEVLLTDPDTIDDLVRRDVLDGLTTAPKTLPCKYLYDEAGSELFASICEVPEYYVPRTELAILRENLDEIASAIGEQVAIVEPGAGSGLKTRLLLDRLQPAAYLPVDISGDYLLGVAEQLQEDYPSLAIEPVVGDFTRPFVLPELDDGVEPVLYFPGSTVGNFTPEAATRLLGDWARLVGEGGRLLIGVDLEKDSAVLEAAYDDRDGVTAAFNKNLLVRINRELGGDFDVDAFRHEARYNDDRRRVEMHLVSDSEQTVCVDDAVIDFAEGESIHTENSHKFSLRRFADIAGKAGWDVTKVWTDDEALFSVQLLTVR